MYAIIETGGKQYKVAKDDILDVEKLAGNKGEAVVFKNVLLAADNQNVQIGRPYLNGAQVSAEKLSDVKTKKTIAFKFRRRKNSSTRIGHRQQLTRVRIKEIKL